MLGEPWFARVMYYSSQFRSKAMSDFKRKKASGRTNSFEY
jgi:hypothetical protein